jgi:hypothetical protein
MDKETLYKVVAMLNARYQEAETFLEDNDLNDLDFNYVEGSKFALAEFKDHLQKVIYADVYDSEPPTEFWEPRRPSADELEDELPF